MRHRQRTLVLVAVVVVVAVGAFMRIEAINDREVWGDEAFTSAVVRQPWSEMMAILREDVHPPLYYLLLKSWAWVFGVSTEALRGFSVLCGVAAIPVVFVAMRDWFKTSVWPALAASLAIAVNPFLVAYGHEARMYALFAFWVALTVLALTRSWSSENPWWRLVYGIALAAMCYTHYLGVLFAGACFVVDMLQRPRLRQIVFGYTLPAVAAVPLLYFFIVQRGYHTTLGWVPDVSFQHVITAWGIFMFGSPVGVYGVPPPNTFLWQWLQPSVVASALAIFLLATVVWLTVRKRWNPALTLLAVLSVLPPVATWALQSAGQSLFVERYLIGVSVTLTLFFVLALAKMKPAVLAACGVVYIALSVLVSPTAHESMFVPMVEQLAHYQRIPIVFTDANDFMISRHYFPDDAPIFLYDAASSSRHLSEWALFREYQLVDLPEEPHIVITTRTDLFGAYEPIGEARWLTIFMSP